MKPKPESNHIAEVSKKVTPRPWHIKWDTLKGSWLIYHTEQDAGPFIRVRDRNEAAFIVRAVNSHEALLEAAKVAFEIMGHETNVSNNRPYLMLKDAIAMAEGDL